MTSECKNKKLIYNKTGFYGYSGLSRRMWIDGESFEGKMTIKQGDVIKVSYLFKKNKIVWGNDREKIYTTYELPITIRN